MYTPKLMFLIFNLTVVVSTSYGIFIAEVDDSDGEKKKKWRISYSGDRYSVIDSRSKWSYAAQIKSIGENDRFGLLHENMDVRWSGFDIDRTSGILVGGCREKISLDTGNGCSIIFEVTFVKRFNCERIFCDLVQIVIIFGCVRSSYAGVLFCVEFQPYRRSCAK